MKKLFFYRFAALCAVFILPGIISCAGTGPANNARSDFSSVEGNEWILLEARFQDETVRMDREHLADFGFEGIYTVLFEDGRISGMGAPNRYFGPYSMGNGNGINIGDLASTMMFSFVEPEGLSENEFFSLMTNTSRWNLRDGMLELYSSRNGAEAVLVFIPN